MTTIHDLTQGSAEWQQYRLEKFGASEAAAMLGISTLVKRNELLHMKATGTAQEFSDWVQKNILDYGHHVEALARPLVEELIGEDLYPVTCSDGRLSASCDGLTMGEDIAFEHKQWNQALAAAIEAGQLPDEYMPQPQQIMMVTPAKKVIFVCSDGTRDNFVYLWVLPDPAWQARIRDGWKQFEADLAEYQHVEVLPPPVAAAVQDLPALSIRVDGQLTLNHNLVLFGQRLQSFIDDIDTNPSDDQAFADAEQAIKVMERAETALGAAKASALGQVSSVDEMVRTVDSYHELARKTRLMLEKVVKARKETIRVEIQQAGKDKAAAHIAALNARLGKPYMPPVAVDFAGVMKGKKTVTSLRDAVDTELARFKIEANAVADRIQINLGTLRELAVAHSFLFADTPSIVLKDPDDLAALVKLRIAEHEQAEAAKAEALRAKIAEEERVKAEKAAEDAERARVAAEMKRQLDEQAASIAAANKAAAAELAAAKASPEGADLSPSAQVLLEQEGAARFAATHPAAAAIVTPIETARPAAAPTTAPALRLGQINERLAPIALTADGLARLGFAPAATDKSAKLYHEADFPAMCAALIRHVTTVAQQAKAA
ncbi:YqaJ viral recombinase family protein [Massilia sp. GER05]|uniref:YqaJ viral recombinase family protein n=1 Tax=Massilia sp. GER05 TaxID=3394605 RepID=UPI003F8298A2